MQRANVYSYAGVSSRSVHYGMNRPGSDRAVTPRRDASRAADTTLYRTGRTYDSTPHPSRDRAKLQEAHSTLGLTRLPTPLAGGLIIRNYGHIVVSARDTRNRLRSRQWIDGRIREDG